MFDLTLEKQIFDFVRAFGIVDLRHVKKFFAHSGSVQVAKVLDILRQYQKIFWLSETELTWMRNPLTMPIQQKQDLFKALDLLCTIPADNVLQYFADKYPTVMSFILDDGVCYDVTVFGKDHWESYIAIVAKERKKNRIGDLPDKVQHIAIVPEPDMIPKVAQYIDFSSFAVVDENGSVDTYALD